MSKDNGGPAFPVAEILNGNWQFQQGQKGMDMRDYFAAKVMGDIYRCVETGGFEKMAKLAYAYADAMLAERNK